ncbi:MAG: potassium channel family protein [Brevinema sp.]
MQYTIREEAREFFLKGKKISDTTIVVRFLTPTLDHYYYTLQSFQKSAELVYENNILIGYDVSYAKIDIETLYAQCRQNEEELVLDECFIPNFSFDQYLKTLNIDISSNSQDFEYPFPDIISARLTFFENINLSRLSINSLDFLCYGSFFAGERSDFSQITINRGFLDFSRSFINKNNDFSLSFTHIKDGDVLFNSAYFEEGRRYFISLFLHNGNFYLNNSYMTGGSFDLSYSSISGEVFAEKMYLKNIVVNFYHVEALGLTFSSSEIRESHIMCHHMKIGEGSKEFEEIYLEHSSLVFDHSEFQEGHLNFSHLEAMKDSLISMKHSIINTQDLDFSYSLIHSPLELSHTDFGSTLVNFWEAELDKVSLDGTISTESINFRAKSCRALSLKGTSLGKLLTISPNIKFEHLQLSGTVSEGKILISWKENNIYEAMNNMYLSELAYIEEKFSSNMRNSKLKELKLLYAQSFLMLKDNFNLIHRYPEEDSAYIQHRRRMREYRMHSKRPSSKLSGFFEWFLLDLLGGYGTDPWRSLFGIIVVWLGFAGSYYYIDSFSVGESSLELSRIGRSLYHSGITLFTIGYGDLIPTGGLMRTLSIIQGFFGVLLPSYFMIAFTRKMLR